MSHFIYVLTLRDGALYVGQTQDLHKRMGSHWRKKSGVTGSEIYVRAHGGPKHVAVIAETQTREDAERKEQQVTRELKSRGYQVTCTPTFGWSDPKTGKFTQKLRPKKAA